MKDDKLLELIRKLDERTAAGALNWEKTVSDEQFQATLSSFVIRIRRELSSQFQDPDYVVTIVDKNGNDLDSFNDVYIAKLTKDFPSYENAFTVMERIFKSAKRKALGVDQAIDSILSELGGQ